MSDSTNRTADRYGGPIVSSRTARVLVALGSAAFLAVVILVGIQVTGQPVTGTLVTYEHVAPDRIAVSFQVTMEPGTEASCTLQALNEGRAQVGFVDVPIPAQAERVSTHELEIATQGDAVSAEVMECRPA